ncbi:hypothetical protein Aperf_G00000015359 [Anoplocephala perfoliata]
MSAPQMPAKQELSEQPPPYSEVVPPYPTMAPGYPPGPGYPTAPGYPQGPGYPLGPPPPQPPQAPYISPQTQQPTTVVYTANALGPGPSRFYCTSCRREVLTDVNYESGLLTWLLVAIICLFGGWMGCCLIPLCCDCDKDVWHKCPSCKAALGKYSRL